MYKIPGLVPVIIMLIAISALSVLSAGGFLIIPQSLRRSTFFHNVLDAKIITPKGIRLSLQQHEDCKNMDSQILVHIDANGMMDVNKQPLNQEGLEERFKEIFAEMQCKVVYISGSRSVKYGQVVYIMDAAVGAGATNLVMTEGLKIEMGYEPTP